MNMKETLLAKIRNKEIIVGVVGLGYVGLPLAVEKAKAGYKTIGFDVQAKKVEMCNRGENYIGDVVNEDLEAIVKSGMFSATTDFSFVKDGRTCFLEVKGVTLENDGVCAFPDAPTERGSKHLRGLTRAAEAGFGAYVLFVVQMENVRYLHPNDATDPAFGKALREAAGAGVQILAMDCRVTPETMLVNNSLPVLL